MSKGLVLVALLAVGFGRAGEGAQKAKPETLIRWNFAGTKQLGEKKELAVLQQILALPESVELRDLGIAAMASNSASHFSGRNSTNINPAAANLIKALLPDLVQSESRLELVTRGTQDADWILAINLGGDRSALWSKNVAELAKLAGMQSHGAPGSESSWSADRDNYRIALSRHKDWTILEGGFGTNATDRTSFKEVKNALGKRRGKEILQAEVNLPLLGAMWNAPTLAHGPKFTLNIAPRNQGLRTEGEIEYPHSLNITPEKWNVPTDIIREPLVAFTAMQGAKEILGKSQFFRNLGAERIPNQLYLWSLNYGPFSMFLAGDVGNPARVVTNIVTGVLPQIKHSPGGNIQVLTNRVAIVWRGLPIVVPFIEQPTPESPYLVTGLFPIENYGKEKAPADLLDQLKQKNLVYYDWEVTSPRLKQWLPIWQLNRLLRGQFFAVGASDRWLEAVAPLLGNAVTEVTLGNAKTLKFVRQSQTGLNAFELVMLAHAIDPYDTLGPGHGTPRPKGSRPAPAAGGAIPSIPNP